MISHNNFNKKYLLIIFHFSFYLNISILKLIYFVYYKILINFNIVIYLFIIFLNVNLILWSTVISNRICFLSICFDHSNIIKNYLKIKNTHLCNFSAKRRLDLTNFFSLYLSICNEREKNPTLQLHHY